ncbi:MAG: hypothetical protein K2L64_00670 [Ureaplasma sp.]|nr:hypothetical protein [Ureaplasma sp.]
MINNENDLLKKNNEQGSENKIINELEKIPNASKYENYKIKNRSNWFNQNLILFLTIIGSCLGAIIIALIVLL